MSAIRRGLAGLAILAVISLSGGSTRNAGADPPVGLPGVRGVSGMMDAGIWKLVEPRAKLSGPLPRDPTAALAGAVTAFGVRLGIPLEAGPTLTAVHLESALAGRLALLLGDLAVCQDATRGLLASLPEPPGAYYADGAGAPPLAGAAAIRACAGRVEDGSLELERFLAVGPRDKGADVDLWPVLRLDLDGTSDVVTHDYVLSVDGGGNDLYLNNAGGNLLDVRRGPAGSAAMEKAGARGCVNPSHDLGEGQCLPSASLLLDMAGDDTYGRKEAPVADADALCTDEPAVPRALTEGAGFAGVGILLDAAGNDHYVGKEAAQGVGHIGGVGVLRDGSGDDTYTAVRLAKGFGTVQGVGILHELGGNDLYDYYMPRALNPEARWRTPGSGGAISTTGLCDNQPRWEEGSGVLGGVGILVEDGGDDTYRPGVPLAHVLGTTEPPRHTGSLGWGDVGGFGLMLERAGHDAYSVIPGRTDGATVGPSAESTGLFVDQ
jgi:hypothetical protein